MACGCVDGSCSCVITGGPGTTVSGGGTAGNPFVISSVGSTLNQVGSILAQAYQYDFADLGGAVGDIILTDPSDVAQQMPAGTLVVHSYVEFLTPFTSAGDPQLRLGWNNPGFEGAIFDNPMSVVNTFPSGVGEYYVGGARDIHLVAKDLILNVGAPDPLTAGLFNVWLILAKLV